MVIFSASFALDSQPVVAGYYCNPYRWGFVGKNLHCPYCGSIDQKVLDSRPARDGGAIRRRRECLACVRRFTTFEEPERPRVFVVKRNGTREEFSAEKCLKSMTLACRKREVSTETLRTAVARIEQNLLQEFEEEAPSSTIGDRVMDELSNIDTVAYVRFASVYKEFETLADFEKIIEGVRETSPDPLLSV